MAKVFRLELKEVTLSGHDSIHHGIFGDNVFRKLFYKADPYKSLPNPWADEFRTPCGLPRKSFNRAAHVCGFHAIELFNTWFNRESSDGKLVLDFILANSEFELVCYEFDETDPAIEYHESEYQCYFNAFVKGITRKVAPKCLITP